MLPLIISKTLTYFNPKLQLKNTELAIKNKLTNSFKFVITLIL